MVAMKRQNRKGMKMAKVKYEFTDEEKAGLVARYHDGLSADALAKEVGCATPTMLGNLRKWGAVIRGKGRRKGTKNAPKVAPVATPNLVTSRPSYEIVSMNPVEENAETDAAEADSLEDSTTTENAEVEPEHAPVSGGFFSRVASFLVR